MAPGEWAGAAHADFAVSLPSGAMTQATLFVMNDQTNLYLAFRIARPMLDPSHVGVWFDNDHDGVSTPGQEDGISFRPGAGVSDEFRCQSGFCRDVDFGGRNDGAAAAANDGSSSIYELSKPLNSGDTGHDFALVPGQRVGFTAVVEITDSSGTQSSCLPVCNILDEPNFGDIVIASAPQAPTPPPPPTTTTAPKPPPPPPRVGVIARVWMSVPGSARSISRVRATKGLKANFLFRVLPVSGSQLQVLWFRNGKASPSGPVPEANVAHVTSAITSSQGISPASYRAVLYVRPPRRRFTAVATARATVG